MGRKTRITREMILDAAYELLDESGIGAVAIKSIAERLGCSTQPVSWQFGSMTELKKELFDYAGEKLYGSLSEAMEGNRASDEYDYDADYLENGMSYHIEAGTKTKEYVFGISWIDDVGWDDLMDENNDRGIETWYGADPTLAL